MKKINLSRVLFTLVLTFVTCLTTIKSACAAGTETWSAQYGPTENLRVFDTNKTPVKTMGRNGKLNLAISFSPCRTGHGCSYTDQEDSSSSTPIRVTVKILSYPSGEVLGSESMTENGLNMFNVSTYRSLNAGEKVKIFFDVSTAPGATKPGYYRRAHFTYKYSFN